jgi:hypothetical protein
MPTDASPDSRAVREALCRYLRERPDAADTLLGIAQWWLPVAMQDIALDRVRQALAELIAAHEVRCTVLPDGTELYARAATGGGRRRGEPM